MKAILISIKPEHCYNITNKNKILEIRTTCPMEWKKYLDGKTNIKPKPCKVYIYETKGKGKFVNCGQKREKIGGKVVAEFTLNKIIKHEKNYIDIEDELCYNFLTEDLENSGFVETHTDLGILNALLDFTSFTNNYGNGKPLYAWHIDELKIYDTPKELSDFKKENKCHYTDCEEGCCFECCTFYDLKDCDGKYSKITVAPQSWCYVEEKGEEL